MCQKIPYEDRAAALADADYIRKQRRYFSKNLGKTAKSGRKLRPYRCPRCGFWHLTTRKK